MLSGREASFGPEAEEDRRRSVQAAELCPAGVRPLVLVSLLPSPVNSVLLGSSLRESELLHHSLSVLKFLPFSSNVMNSAKINAYYYLFFHTFS